jgi:hypothetical protein
MAARAYGRSMETIVGTPSRRSFDVGVALCWLSLALFSLAQVGDGPLLGLSWLASAAGLLLVRQVPAAGDPRRRRRARTVALVSPVLSAIGLAFAFVFLMLLGMGLAAGQ